MYGGEELHFDTIIPRIDASHTFYGTAVVRQFEVMGVFPAVESQSIARAGDKLRSFQLLSHADIGLPVTGFAHATRDTAGLVDSVGGAPVVIKLLEGTQGLGVVLAETRKAAESIGIANVAELATSRVGRSSTPLACRSTSSSRLVARCWCLGWRALAHRRTSPSPFLPTS